MAITEEYNKEVISGELFAGWWHAAIGVLVAAAFGHNLKQLARSRAAKHAVNTCLYGVLVVYELREAKGHWQS